MRLLAAVVDHARLDQIGETHRHHFRMDAKVAMMRKPRAHRIRQRADTHLQAIAIFHEPCDDRTDGIVDFRCVAQAAGSAG